MASRADGPGRAPERGDPAYDELYAQAALACIRMRDPFNLVPPIEFPTWSPQSIDNWLENHPRSMGDGYFGRKNVEKMMESRRDMLHFRVPKQVNWMLACHRRLARVRSDRFLERYLLRDGTWFRSDQESQMRLAVGPRWSNNSCAVDVALMLILWLDIGVCRLDQMNELEEAQKPKTVTRRAWQFARQDWSGEVESVVEDMDAFRDDIHENYVEDFNARAVAKGRQTTEIGNFQMISDVLDTLLGYPPQLSWCETKAYVCYTCHEYRFDPTETSWACRPTDVREFNSLDAIPFQTTAGSSTQTLQKVVQARFMPHETQESARQGGRCTVCNMSRRLIPVVAEELPPRLMIDPVAVDVLQTGVCDFGNLIVAYYAGDAHGPLAVKKAAYRPIAIVHSSGDHFWLSAVPGGKGGWRTYDGNAKPTVVSERNLDRLIERRRDAVLEGAGKTRSSRLKRPNGVAMLVYERVREPV